MVMNVTNAELIRMPHIKNGMLTTVSKKVKKAKTEKAGRLEKTNGLKSREKKSNST